MQIVSSLGIALEMFAMTDKGKVREQNEDEVFIRPEKGMAILTDGMGGYNAGDVAAKMAIAHLSETLEQKNFADKHVKEITRDIYDAISKANYAIWHSAFCEASYAGMGTTVVMGCFVRGSLYIAHLGDSRAYGFREGRLKRLTRDHSPVQDLIDNGFLTEEEAQWMPEKRFLNRALGVYSVAEPELSIYQVNEGDIYLFCSDGLNDMVTDEEIEREMNRMLRIPSVQLSWMGEQFIQLANQHGGLDNIAVILAKVDKKLTKALE